MNLNNSANKLLVRHGPKNGQCIQDYLMQISELNGLRGIKGLSRLYGVTCSDLIHMPDQSLQELISGRTTFENINVSRKFRPTLRRPYVGLNARVCPYCIADGDPITDNCNLPLSVICNRHKTLFYDKCPKCHTPLTYLRKKRNKCDRGCTISIDSQHPKQEEIFHLLEIFAPWKLWDTPPEITISLIDLEIFICNLIRVMHLSEGTIKKRKKRVEVQDLEGLMPMLDNTHSGFKNNLTEFYSRRAKSSFKYICFRGFIPHIKHMYYLSARELDPKWIRFRDTVLRNIDSYAHHDSASCF